MYRNILFSLLFLVCHHTFFGQKFKFKEIDSTYIFDKAKYHLQSVQNDKLDERQAFVHTAIFIDWCLNKGLLTQEFQEKYLQTILHIKIKACLPTQLYVEIGGVFTGRILNLKGYNFAMHYFHLSNGKYLKEYEKLFDLKNRKVSFYSIADDWDNYEKVAIMLDNKFDNWNN